MTDRVNFLALSDYEKTLTCGVAMLKLNSVNWEHVGGRYGKSCLL